MQCKNHNDREGLNVCSVCNEYFCDECFDNETQLCVSCKETQELANDILDDILNTIEAPEQAKINFDPTDILTQIENEINVQQQIEKLEVEINSISASNGEENVDTQQNVEVVVTETVLDDVTIEEEIIEAMASEAALEDDIEAVLEEVVETAAVEVVLEETVDAAVSEVILEEVVETVVTEEVVDGIVEELFDEVMLEENKVQENSSEDINNFDKIDLSKDNVKDTNDTNSNSSNVTNETDKTKSLSWKEKLFGEKPKTENCEVNKEPSNNTDDTTEKQPNKFSESVDEFADKTKEGFNDLKDKTKEGYNDLKDNMYENRKIPVTDDMEEIIAKIEDTNTNGEYDHLLSKFNRYYGQDSGKTNSSSADSSNTDNSNTNDANLALPLRINDVLYFIASLIPGAAQLYLGLTKRGSTILIIAAVFLFITSNPSLFIITTILSFADAQKLRNIYYRGGKIEDTNADVMALMKNGYVIIIIIAAIILGV